MLFQIRSQLKRALSISCTHEFTMIISGSRITPSSKNKTIFLNKPFFAEDGLFGDMCCCELKKLYNKNWCDEWNDHYHSSGLETQRIDTLEIELKDCNNPKGVEISIKGLNRECLRTKENFKWDGIETKHAFQTCRTVELIV